MLEAVLLDELEERQAAVFELRPRVLRLLAAVQLGMRNLAGELAVDQLDLRQLARMFFLVRRLGVFPRDLLPSNRCSRSHVRVHSFFASSPLRSRTRCTMS